jgi:hypothetical protein
MTLDQEIVLEVIRQINLDDSDRQILLVHAEDESIVMEFGSILSDMYPDKQCLIVEQSHIDILGDVPEDVMNEYGWYKK